MITHVQSVAREGGLRLAPPTPPPHSIEGGDGNTHVSMVITRAPTVLLARRLRFSYDAALCSCDDRPLRATPFACPAYSAPSPSGCELCARPPIRIDSQPRADSPSAPSPWVCVRRSIRPVAQRARRATPRKRVDHAVRLRRESVRRRSVHSVVRTVLLEYDRSPSAQSSVVRSSTPARRSCCSSCTRSCAW